jgi:hypothetical protein
MKNTIQLNEINEVDLGDDTLTADPTSGSAMAASTEYMPDEPVVVESGDGDGDGVVSVSGAGGEGGSAALKNKERQKTLKVWNDFSSITVNGVRKS